MVERKCKLCKRTIFNAKSEICRHCLNKEKIEEGGFQSKSNEKADDWKKWYSK
jgi:hypothetical protein